MVLPYKVLARDRDNYLTPITPAELQRARKQGGSGWAPAFSATVNFTDYARAYLRYTETLRFPSIFEGTYGFSTAAGSFARYGYGWKPEHAKNWEIGYIHDLTGLFPKMKSADFRINYFHNKTKNVIDRDYNLEFEQFDKLLRTGVELQTRFDTGKFFGGLGVLRTLKNWMCDDSYAYRDIDVVSRYLQEGKLIKHPTCNHGSITGGYLATAIQPRWSIDADLGGRFLTSGPCRNHPAVEWRTRPQFPEKSAVVLARPASGRVKLVEPGREERVARVETIQRLSGGPDSSSRARALWFWLDRLAGVSQQAVQHRLPASVSMTRCVPTTSSPETPGLPLSTPLAVA